MMSPYARLRMLVTPNWSVNPTPATARMDAVTMPNPIAGTSVLTIASSALRRSRPAATSHRGWSRSPAERCDLGRRHRADDHRVALQVFCGLECPGRVMPLVEHD